MTTYSTDLRERVVRAYEQGAGSIRQLARRYEVSKNTVQAWLDLKRSTGNVTPLPAKGGKVSQLVGLAEHLEAMVQAHPDYTLAQYCETWLEQQGVAVAESTMCRWLQQRALTLKKKTRRSQQAQSDAAQQQRLDYWQQVSTIEPCNLVFLDEMGVLLGLMRLMGRATQGQRVYDIKPFYRGTRVNVIGAISSSKVLALKALDRALTGEQFKQFLQADLAPQLWSGAVVVMDNLPAHKVQGVPEILSQVGAKALYLSPYSPEFNPIEHWWWELKAFIRQFVPKTKETLVKLLHLGSLLSSSGTLRNYFAHCCYCAS